MAYLAKYKTALEKAALELQVNPDDLKALIQFESGWNPAAYNRSGAVGLIQFMPVTLRRMGLLPPDLSIMVSTKYDVVIPNDIKLRVRDYFLQRFPTVEEQLLGPVIQYLKPMRPFPDLQSLTMAVFYPSFRDVKPDTAFPPKVQAQNPGITKVQDYLDKVLKKKALAKSGSLVALAFAGFLAYYMLRRRTV